MPFTVYSLMHVVGALLVFAAIGSAIATRGTESTRKHQGIAHGVGMLLLVVAGFGMLAKLEYGFPLWVIVKMVLWVVMAIMPTLVRKSGASAGLLWSVLAALALVISGLALYKPF